MLESLAPARRRLVLVVAAAVALAVVAGVVAILVTRDSPVETTDQDEPGVVLLVPGYGGSTTGLDVLAGALRDAGRDAEVVDPVGDGRGDLRDQAQHLADVVGTTLDGGGSGTVDLVGYSAGGIVVRWFVDQLDGASLVRRVVTLSAPNHGTDLAALAGGVGGDACPEACRQLAPDSDLLRELNAGDETPSGPSWVALWTADDKTVVPPSSGALDGADVALEVQDLCPDLTVAHGDMPSDPTVDALVVDLLGPGTPETPTTCPS